VPLSLRDASGDVNPDKKVFFRTANLDLESTSISESWFLTLRNRGVRSLEAPLRNRNPDRLPGVDE